MAAQQPWETKWRRPPNASLGRGGQGATFLVESRSDPAVKAVLKLQVEIRERDRKARRRMYQEVANLTILSDAGARVPRVLDANTEHFADQATPLYFVMELVQGKTLLQLVQQSGCLPLKEAIELARGLCETLKVAFRYQIYHRDIKPDNIIIPDNQHGAPVIVDFGLSFNETDDADLTDPTEALDNKFLSLPERRGPDENKRDPRSDLTSVCAILHYCLTGCVPKHLRNSENRPPHRWTNYSIANVTENARQRALLENLFDRGFQYEIALRYQTLDELVDRLCELLDPGAPAPRVDLAELASRESSVLYARDRKTQIAIARGRCEPLMGKLREKSMQLRQLLQRSGRHELHFTPQEHLPSAEKLPDGLDDTGNVHTSWVKVPEHDLAVAITYRVACVAFESVVYRCIGLHRIQYGVFVPTQSPPKEVEPWTVVSRYQNEQPDFDVVLDDY